MNIKKLAYTALASSVLAVCAAPAHATLILTLFDGTTTKTIQDNTGGDADGTVGVISATTSFGTWFINFTGGVSNMPGADGVAFLDLSSTNFSRGAGTMVSTLTDYTFTTPSGSSIATTTASGGCTGLLGGSCAGGSNISFNSLLNNSSVSSLSGSGLGFSGMNSTGVDTTGGFSLQQVATITHTGAGISNFNIITTVPEPATLGLLGLGLIGLGFVRRRRNV